MKHKHLLKKLLLPAAMLPAMLLSEQATAQTTLTYSYTGSLQTFTVPSCVSILTIECRGAQGGGNGGGGLGARMIGTYTTSPGTVYTVVVGQQGQLQVGGNTQNSSGGGGGSFVYSSGPTLLVAAGGGGGKCNWTSSTPLHAGAAGTVSPDGNQASSSGALGGTSGQGGAAGFWSSSEASGGGAGWLSAGGGPYGGSSYPTWAGGPGYCNGGGGGCGGVGGFGGGGGGGNLYGGGGGGGGYSGGGGGTDPTHGGGGGSYSAGSNQNNTSGYQTGNGLVIISYNLFLLTQAQTTASQVCIGGSAILSASVIPTPTWNTGSTSANITVTPSVTTSYTAAGTQTNGCITAAVITITVNPLPVLNASSAPALLCVGSDATLTAAGASTYSWDTGANGNNVTVSPSVSTTYTVVGTSSVGCSNSTTVAVNVNTNTLTVTANTAVCMGHSLNLSASGATTYVWSTGAPFSNINVTPASNTTYTVGGIDVNGCSLTGAVTVTVNPSPNATLNASRLVACKGESITLTGNGAATYTIDGTAGATKVVGLPVDVPTTFTMLAANAEGCTNTATVLIQVNRCNGINSLTVSAPRFDVFPNPAENGTFSVKSTADVSLEVYNQLGSLVAAVRLGASNNRETSFSNLAPGVYFVKDANSQNIQKVIVD